MQWTVFHGKKEFGVFNVQYFFCMLCAALCSRHTAQYVQFQRVCVCVCIVHCALHWVDCITYLIALCNYTLFHARNEPYYSLYCMLIDTVWTVNSLTKIAFSLFLSLVPFFFIPYPIVRKYKYTHSLSPVFYCVSCCNRISKRRKYTWITEMLSCSFNKARSGSIHSFFNIQSRIFMRYFAIALYKFVHEHTKNKLNDKCNAIDRLTTHRIREEFWILVQVLHKRRHVRLAIRSTSEKSICDEFNNE